MATDIDVHDLPPSTSRPQLANGVKRSAAVFEEGRYEDPSVISLSAHDDNAWYYPSHGYDSDDEIRFSAARGNWGRKTVKDAKWVRRGKMAAWAPAREEWEVEERARKRIKLLLQQQPESSGPVVLPHLRSPSPPLMAPYPTPSTQHISYTSLVMDKAVTNSFRSRLIDELENATNNLIQGEAAMRRALGRLWQVMNEDPEQIPGNKPVVPKREDEGDESERDRRLSRAPDLTPIVHKLFLSPPSDSITAVYDLFPHPDIQFESLEKSLATLRELQDDGREYVERLEEIRDGLGETRTQRNGVWDLVRRKAIKELHDVASAAAL